MPRFKKKNVPNGVTALRAGNEQGDVKEFAKYDSRWNIIQLEGCKSLRNLFLMTNCAEVEIEWSKEEEFWVCFDGKIYYKGNEEPTLHYSYNKEKNELKVAVLTPINTEYIRGNFKIRLIIPENMKIEDTNIICDSY